MPPKRQQKTIVEKDDQDSGPIVKASYVEISVDRSKEMIDATLVVNDDLRRGYTESERARRQTLTLRCVFPFSDVVMLKGLVKYVGKINIVEANIGAGKTVFCKAFCNLLRYLDTAAVVIEEYVNPELLQMYLGKEEDTPEQRLARRLKYAFLMQEIMCTERLNNYRRALKFKEQGMTVIMDRSLFGDLAFELMLFDSGMISKEEHSLYLNRLKEKSRLLGVPDNVIQLEVTIDVMKARIKKRGRAGEVAAYDTKYLTNLQTAYNHCLSKDVCNMDIQNISYNVDEEAIVKMSEISSINPGNSAEFREGAARIYSLLTGGTL